MTGDHICSCIMKTGGWQCQTCGRIYPYASEKTTSAVNAQVQIKHLDFGDTNLVDDLLENGNRLRLRAQKAEARIAELEALISDIIRVIHRQATVSDKGLVLYLRDLYEYASCKTKQVVELEKQVAALKKIAIENRVYLNRYRVDYEVDDSMMEVFTENAKKELEEEHPEAMK